MKNIIKTVVIAVILGVISLIGCTKSPTTPNTPEVIVQDDRNRTYFEAAGLFGGGEDGVRVRVYAEQGFVFIHMWDYTFAVDSVGDEVDTHYYPPEDRPTIKYGRVWASHPDSIFIEGRRFDYAHWEYVYWEYWEFFSRELYIGFCFSDKGEVGCRVTGDIDPLDPLRGNVHVTCTGAHGGSDVCKFVDAVVYACRCNPHHRHVNKFSVGTVW